jgi:hypothetical protein
MNAVRLARLSITVALVSLVGACSRSSNAGNVGPSSFPTTSAGTASTPSTSASTAQSPVTPLADWPNPKVNGKIAFGRWLDSAQTTRAIFVINPDGTGERQLTHPPDEVVDNHPDWSPDSSKIAFERCAVRCETWVMNADGSGAKRLGPKCDADPPACEDRGAPAWSPHGKTLASNRAFGPVENDTIKSSQLVLIDPKTGKVLRRLDAQAPYAGDTGEAGWSPDGRRLVFNRLNSSTGKPPNARALFVIDADGSGVRQLTPWDLGGGDHPVWSPNGKLILFRTVSGPDDMYGNLYTIHPDGSGLHELTDYDPGTIVLSYSFSPGRTVDHVRQVRRGRRARHLHHAVGRDGLRSGDPDRARRQRPGLGTGLTEPGRVPRRAIRPGQTGSTNSSRLPNGSNAWIRR